MTIFGENSKLIRKIKWEEVFLYWYETEGNNENWINLAMERGYESWADWRITAYARPFECDKTDWVLYEVSNAEKVVSEFYGGPFRTWIEKYYTSNAMRFDELIKNEEAKNKKAVQEMRNNFPTDKVITCLEVRGKIYVIEGMHRACALALMNEEGMKLGENIKIAVGKSKLKELPVVGKNKN